MIDPKFPNLFVLGPMKAGTTTLHDTLGKHPEIFMAQHERAELLCRGEAFWIDLGSWQGMRLGIPHIGMMLETLRLRRV